MKLSTIKLSILLITCITFSCVEVKGQGKEKDRPDYAELLEKMDKDDDGTLSEAEVKGPLKDHFEEIDANEDGFISEEEFDKAPKPKGKRPARNE